MTQRRKWWVMVAVGWAVLMAGVGIELAGGDNQLLNNGALLLVWTLLLQPPYEPSWGEYRRAVARWLDRKSAREWGEMRPASELYEELRKLEWDDL